MIFLYVNVSYSIFSRSSESLRRLILEFPVPMGILIIPVTPCILSLSSPLISYTYPLYPSLLPLSLVHISCPPLPSSVITCAPTVTPSLLLSLPAHASITPAFPFIHCMVSACSVKCVMLTINRELIFCCQKS